MCSQCVIEIHPTAIIGKVIDKPHGVLHGCTKTYKLANRPYIYIRRFRSRQLTRREPISAIQT